MMVRASGNNRITHIDLLRGYAIILMVLGHVPLGDNFRVYIHSFHMPVFFFISGWLFKPSPVFASLKKKFSRLMIPYFTAALLGYLLWFAELRPATVEELVRPILSVLWINTEGMPIVGAIWFLTAMLFADCVYRFLYNRFPKQIHWIIPMLALVGIAEGRWLPIQLPWAIGPGCVGLLFFHAGTVFRKAEAGPCKELLNLPISVVMPGLLMQGILALSLGLVNMRTGQYPLFPLSIINALLGIILYWNLFAWLEQFLKRGWVSGIAVWLKKIGENSIVYLCLNEIVINVVKSVLYKLSLDGLILTVLASVISLTGLYVAEQMIVRTKLRVLLGK